MLIKWLIAHTKNILIVVTLSLIVFLLLRLTEVKNCTCTPPTAIVKVTPS